MAKGKTISRLLVLILLAPLLAAASPISEEGRPPAIIAGHFSAATIGAGLPEGWQPLTFKNIERHTSYRLIGDDSGTVLQAVADASASGLVHRADIDPKEYPFIEWRWKVNNVLVKGDVRKKDGDDYPARLYITFDYDPAKLGFADRLKYKTIKLLHGDVPVRAITYIWESKAPEGTVVPNPYTNWVMMIVVESGKTKVGQWVKEKRNIYEDYKKAFREEPGRITGVAVMTDTDNTGESAVAYYGDIVFKKEE